MYFNKPYNRQEFLTLLQTKIFPHFVRQERPLQINRKTAYFVNNNVYKLWVVELDKEIHVLEIQQKSSKDPRITLTKDAFKVLDDNGIDNALVIFYSQDNTSYRFSLLTTKYIDWDKKETSSYKRFSYILWPGEKTKTPEKQLLHTVKDYQDLVSRFDVEVVRKDFFEKYLELYVRLYKEIKKEESFAQLLESQQVDLVSFTKNLLWKIVFIYFIQQKWWLWLGKKETEYGKGNKNFMRVIRDNFEHSNESMSIEKTWYFYNDYLERLFFEGLNKDRRDTDDWFPNLQMKVPYLNGWLFTEDYQWRDSYKTKISNDIFSNATKKWDEADGILDIFDRYNFTVDEDSLYDSDIAVDPEMLGRIFEKMISISHENIDDVVELYDVKGKKSKIDFWKALNKKLGAFYTPREIVHYMTKESLIAYLINTIKWDKTTNEHLIRVLFELKEKFLLHKDDITNDWFDEQILDILWSSIEQIDSALKKVKILDPAVWSWAFPMWLLHEISSIRYYIYGVFHKEFGGTVETYKNTEWKISLYKIKREIILNNIYWVDIDPWAIDIARLRFWLSLVVDEEQPEPLPNFEFKFVCANTLIPLQEELKQQDLFAYKDEPKLDKLRKLKEQYYNLSSKKEKKDLKEVIWEYTKVDTTLFSNPTPRAKQITEFGANFDNSKHSHSFFDPSLMMSEWKGFDIVIGNPPYIDSEMMVKKMPKDRELYTNIYKYAKWNWDIFIPFTERWINFLKENWNISFIIPNKLIWAKYSETLRNGIIKSFSVIEIRDYSSVNVFKEADVYPITFLFKKQINKKQNNVKVTVMKNEIDIDYSNTINSDLFHKDIYWDRYFIKDRLLLNIINKISFNKELISFVKMITWSATVWEAYFIKEKLFDWYKDNSLKFINTGSIDPYVSLRGKKETTYIKWKYLNPMILKNDLESIHINRLKQAENPKLIIAWMATKFEVYYDQWTYLAGKSTTIILDNSILILKYILWILNSKLLSFWYSNFYRSLKMAWWYLNFNTNTLKTIPIPETSEAQQQLFIDLVDQILAKKKENPYADTSDLEKEIDQMVYELYELTKEEVKVVEDSVK